MVLPSILRASQNADRPLSQRFQNRVWTLVVLGCVSVGGCQFRAYEIEPHPTFAMSSVSANVDVRVEDSVENDFLLAASLGAPALDVKGWRDAVHRGVIRGKERAFSSVDNSAGWQLIVREAVPRLVTLELDESGHALALTAAVHWRAILFDPLMQPALELDGDSTAPGTFRNMSDASPLLARAIEAAITEIFARIVVVVRETQSASTPDDLK